MVNLGELGDTGYYVVSAVDHDGYAGGYSIYSSPTGTVAVAIAAFEARSVGSGIELVADFASTFNAVTVNIYRSDGDNAAFARLGTVGVNGTHEFTFLDGDVRPGTTYRYRIGVVDSDGEFLSQVARVMTPAVTTSLAQNVPNPFNPTTSIRFALSAPQQVRLTVYDARGRLVRVLVDEARDSGVHRVEWDGRDDAMAAVSSGIYFFRLEAGSFVQSRKMVLLR